MTTNVNYNLITVSPQQRNSNTLVQGSTIISNNGTLNQSLDFQTLRTVKAQLIFPLTGLASGNLVLTNEYDNSATSFKPGDIIIAMTLANASTSYPGTSFPTPFTAGNITFYTHDGKTYPPLATTNGNWVVNPNFTAATGNQLTSSINLNSFGSGIPSAANPPVVLNVTNTLIPQNAGFGIGTVGDGAVYRDYINLVCACSGVPAVSTGYSAVNVTMLVMNSSLAQ